MTAPPTLLTRRLLLRPPAAADADRIQRLAGDRRIADTTGRIPHPYPDGVAGQWIDKTAAAWEEGRALALAVTRRERPGLIGVVSLETREDGEEAGLGYWIGADDWARGYATEAAQALLDYGFVTLGLARVSARCLVRNPASARVLTRLGLRRRERLTGGIVKWGRAEDLDVYTIGRARYLRVSAAE